MRCLFLFPFLLSVFSLCAQSADSVYVDENGLVIGDVEKVKTAPVLIAPSLSYLLELPRLQTDGEMPGMTPLMWIAREGSVSGLMAALANDAPVNARDLAGKNALHHAVEAKNLNVVYPLIQAGVEIHAVDVTGENVLHKAARNGLTELCGLFLQFGLKPDFGDKSGITPLMRALAGEHYETALLLLKNGASPDIFDHHGNTALHAWAAGLIERGSATSEIRIKKGKKKKKKKKGPDPEETEVPEVDSKWKKLFKAYKFDVQVKNENGLTPIEFARLAGREDISATLELSR